ncbi:MAG: GNAT family N-acetyltransferase [FCB group bacterium]|nr:GNAT family N-acetyltransferase [FCB group bacterium]
MEVIQTRNGKPEDVAGVLEIARSLTEWFTETGVKNIQRDLEFQKILLAEIADNIVGFLSYYTYDGVGNIGWMGVVKSHHRASIGKLLFECFEEEMKNYEIYTLQVLTLGEGVDYMPYEKTRKFYRAMGFTNYRVEPTDDPECPESLTLRKIIKNGS